MPHNYLKTSTGTAYGSIAVKNHNEIIALESSKFKRFLSGIYYNEFLDVPYSEAVNNAIQVLCTKAQFDGPSIHLSLRVTFSKDKNTIYYDLTNDEYQIVEISKSGWNITNNEANLFARYNQKLQVLPDRNYDNGIFNEFMKINNVKNKKSQLLLKVYIISLYIPQISHPKILFLADRNILINQAYFASFAPFGQARHRIQHKVQKAYEMYFALYQALRCRQRRE